MNQRIARTRTLHIRRLADFPLGTDDWLDEQLAGANEIFAKANLAFAIESDIATPFLEGVVHIEACVNDGQPTEEQLELFRRASDVPPQDIVVFLAQGFDPWQGGGCAWHPEGQLGCIVTVGKPFDTEHYPKWKLAHELGHVLGLQHVDLSMRLMYPSVQWAADPPRLNREELQAIRGERALPSPPPVEVLAITEKTVRFELSKIEPDYLTLVNFGSEAAPLLIRYCQSCEDDEYKARAIYALGLLSNASGLDSSEIADIIADAARSGPEVRRVAAAAASAWGLPMPNKS